MQRSLRDRSRLGRGVSSCCAPRERILDLREAFGRHQIGMVRDRAIRQVLFTGLAFVRLFGECTAHGRERVGHRMVSQGLATRVLSPLPLAGEGRREAAGRGHFERASRPSPGSQLRSLATLSLSGRGERRRGPRNYVAASCSAASSNMRAHFSPIMMLRRIGVAGGERRHDRSVGDAQVRNPRAHAADRPPRPPRSIPILHVPTG